MEENYELLKYLFHEDLFIIDETAKSQNNTESLIQTETDNLSIVQDPEPINFFGKNEKGILILIHESESNLPKQPDLDFLMKVVESGLKYSKNDFALVNTSKYLVNHVLSEIPYDYLIAFGEPKLYDNRDRQLYELYYEEAKKKLYAERLSVIASNESKKRKLWNALKTMFNL